MVSSIVPNDTIFREGFCLYLRLLRDLREDSDLSQTDIANILHIQQTVYSRYERGFQTIPLEHLLTLANYYKVSVDYILDRTRNPAINK